MEKILAKNQLTEIEKVSAGAKGKKLVSGSGQRSSPLPSLTTATLCPPLPSLPDPLSHTFYLPFSPLFRLPFQNLSLSATAVRAARLKSGRSGGEPVNQSSVRWPLGITNTR